MERTKTWGWWSKPCCCQQKLQCDSSRGAHWWCTLGICLLWEVPISWDEIATKGRWDKAGWSHQNWTLSNHTTSVRESEGGLELGRRQIGMDENPQIGTRCMVTYLAITSLMIEGCSGEISAESGLVGIQDITAIDPCSKLRGIQGISSQLSLAPGAYTLPGLPLASAEVEPDS